MRIVLFSGRRRQAFDLLSGRSNRITYAVEMKRFLFPANGSYFKAKRRGERALAGAL